MDLGFVKRNFNQLYNSEDPNMIKRELKQLEKNKFLQGEINMKEVLGKIHTYLFFLLFIKNFYLKKCKYIDGIPTKQIEDINAQLPDEKIFDDYKELKERVEKEQSLLEEEKFQTNSLTFMLEKRKVDI